MKISAYVMAKNEEETIEKCLSSLNWCDEVILADTGSTDATITIAKKMGATILEVPFEGFGPTRNRVIDLIEADWLVCFDADEICTEALAQEIVSAIKAGKYEVLQAPRQNFLLKKKIRHSGWFPDFRHPVAFKKGSCRYTDSLIHEGFVTEKPVFKLNEPYAHFSYRRLEQMMVKERSYALMGIAKVLNKNSKPTMAKALIHSCSAFLRHYVIKRGFLDGWAGLVIALSSAHSTFFRYAMAFEEVNDLKERTCDVVYSLNDEKDTKRS